MSANPWGLVVEAEENKPFLLKLFVKNNRK